jgi:hypothetical protein
LIGLEVESLQVFLNFAFSPDGVKILAIFLGEIEMTAGTNHSWKCPKDYASNKN